MKYKKLGLNAVLLLGIGLTGLHAQNMNVKENTGKDNSYVLQNIQKMTFSSGNLIITEKGKSDATYSLSEVKRLGFSSLITNSENVVLEEDKLIIYPNPVQNTVNIAVSEKGLLIILTIDGKIMSDANWMATIADRKNDNQ